MNALRCLLLVALIAGFPLGAAAQPVLSPVDLAIAQIPEIGAPAVLVPWPGRSWLVALPGGSWDFGSCARQWAPCSGKPLQGTVIREADRTAAVSFPIGENQTEPRLFGSVSLAPDRRSDSGGGFTAVWSDDLYLNVRFGTFFGGEGILARTFHAPGDPAGPAFRVNEESRGRQTSPASAPLSGGGLVVVWESQATTGDPHRLQGRIFTTAGAAIDGDFALAPELPGEQRFPAVAAHADGGFLVAWLGQLAGRPVVFARRYDVDGAPLGEAARLDGSADPVATAPAVVALPTGAFAVVWRGERSAGRRAFLRLRYVDAAGQPRGTVRQVNPYPLRLGGPRPDLAVDSAENLMVVWNDVRPQDAQHLGIFATVYNSGGGALARGLRIDLRRREDPKWPTVVSDGLGLFTVFWQVDQLPQPFASALVRGRRLVIGR